MLLDYWFLLCERRSKQDTFLSLYLAWFNAEQRNKLFPSKLIRVDVKRRLLSCSLIGLYLLLAN